MDMPDLYEFELNVSRCDNPITFIAGTIEEAMGMMELSFPKWDYRKCLDWRVVRKIRECEAGK